MMPVLVLDDFACQELIRQRQAMGGDRHDEVWKGTYVLNPLASLENQRLVLEFSRIFSEVVNNPKVGQVFPGANFTDCEQDWEKNYRAVQT